MSSLRTQLRLVLTGSLFALALAPASFAADAPAARSFDEAWQEIQQLKDARPPAGTSPADMVRGMTAQKHRLIRLAWETFEDYPKEPRRWQAAVEIIRATHGYVYDTIGDPEKDGPKAYLRDEAARAAWGAYAKALYEQLLAAPDLPPETIKAAIEAYIYRLNMTPSSKREELRAVIDEFARRFPLDPKIVSFEQIYYMGLQSRDPGAAVDHIQRLLKSDNPALREMAEGKLRLATGQKLDLKFTAVDGREVDSAKLRGKVVLIDFWATWCGPCVAELPNVKKVYDQYHAQGFEVVAISLDSDKKKLLDFISKNGLPWPQHFDGKGPKNEFAQKYAVAAIPAMLLVDRTGKIVSSNARGEKLEAEVKRLLSN